jgi:hypothetical protein
MSLENILKTIQQNFNFTKEATIADIKFELGLLTFDEEQKVSSISDASMEPIVFYNENRKRILAYSIKSLNGEKVPTIVEVKSGEKAETKERAIYLREILDSLPSRVFDELFEMYIDLKEESEKKIEAKIEYKWFKTKEEREAERKKAEEEENKPQEEKPITFTEIKEAPEETTEETKKA